MTTPTQGGKPIVHLPSWSANCSTTSASKKAAAHRALPIVAQDDRAGCRAPQHRLNAVAMTLTANQPAS